ncbi:unnamed protein product, partial [Rotaria sp. Silwood2]
CKAQVQLAVYLDNIAIFTQNGQIIHQIIDNTGKIINQVICTEGQILSSSVVDDYLQNMTFTGVTQTLDNGNIIEQYNYSPPAGSSLTDNILVNIVFNALGNVFNAIVVNPLSTPTTTSTSTATTISNAATIVSTTA